MALWCQNILIMNCVLRFVIYCTLLCAFVGQCIEFLCNCYDAWLSWQTTFSTYTTFPSVYDAAGSTQQEPSFSDSVPYPKIWCHSRTLNWGTACQTLSKTPAGLQYQAFQVDKWLSITTILFDTYLNCLQRACCMFWFINTSSGTVTNVQERKKQKYKSQPCRLINTEFRPQVNITILKVFSSVLTGYFSKSGTRAPLREYYALIVYRLDDKKDNCGRAFSGLFSHSLYLL